MPFPTPPPQLPYNPFDTSTFPRTSFKHNDLTWAYLDFLPSNFDPSNPDKTPTAICLHGFPDHSYGYRHHAPHLVKRGFRVLIPDFPGCGKTRAPHATENDVETRRRYYSVKARCDGVAALLDWVGVRRAYVVGHDWGGYTLWRFALFYPERCIALASICIPYSPPAADYVSLEDAQKINTRLNYQICFCSDKAEQEINERLDFFLRTMYMDPSNPLERLPVNVFKLASRTRSYFEGLDPNMPRTAMLTDVEYNEYLRTWTEDMAGFNGALQFYRTRREDWEAERAVLGRGIGMRSLFVLPSHEPVVKGDALEAIKKLVPKLEVGTCEGGHWVLQDPKVRDQVGEMVGSFLDSCRKDEGSAKL